MVIYDWADCLGQYKQQENTPFERVLNYFYMAFYMKKQFATSFNLYNGYQTVALLLDRNNS